MHLLMEFNTLYLGQTFVCSAFSFLLSFRLLLTNQCICFNQKVKKIALIITLELDYSSPIFLYATHRCMRLRVPIIMYVVVQSPGLSNVWNGTLREPQIIWESRMYVFGTPSWFKGKRGICYFYVVVTKLMLITAHFTCPPHHHVNMIEHLHSYIHVHVRAQSRFCWIYKIDPKHTEFIMLNIRSHFTWIHINFRLDQIVWTKQNKIPWNTTKHNSRCWKFSSLMWSVQYKRWNKLDIFSVKIRSSSIKMKLLQ